MQAWRRDGRSRYRRREDFVRRAEELGVTDQIIGWPTCPICEQEFPFQSSCLNGHFPFCSEKCQLVDQGLRKPDASTQENGEKLPLPLEPDPVYGYALVEEELATVNDCDPMVYHDYDEEVRIDPELFIPTNGAPMSKLLDIEMPKLIRRSVIETERVMRRDTQRGTNRADGDAQTIGHFMTNLRRHINDLHNDVAGYDVKKFLVNELCKKGQWLAPGEISGGFSIPGHSPAARAITESRVQMWAANSNSALSDDEEKEAQIHASLDYVAQQQPIIDSQFAAFQETENELNTVLDQLADVIDDEGDVLPTVEAAIIR